MRITEIELNGEKHVLCLNLWALKRIMELWGDYRAAIQAISEGELLEKTGEQLIMLDVLLRGGAIYAAEMGMENPEPMELTNLLKNDAGNLLKTLPGTVMEALNRSMECNISTVQKGPSDNSAGNNGPEWLLWYGLKVGLSYRESHAIPLGELMDLASVEQVKHEGAKLKLSEEDEFFELLKRR